MRGATARHRKAVAFILLWLVLLGLVGFYLFEAAVYVGESELQPGSTFLNRGLWYFAHIAIALPIFLIAPLQFIATLRMARPATHRFLGRLFLGASALAGSLATYLGLTIEFEGSRLPLALFGLLWVAFSAMAWICARRGDFAGHRQFVIRSLGIAFAFVWIRLFASFEDHLLWFIGPGDLREATREWMSLVIPLLAVEAWLSWWPALQSAHRPPVRHRAPLGAATERL